MLRDSPLPASVNVCNLLRSINLQPSSVPGLQVERLRDFAGLLHRSEVSRLFQCYSTKYINSCLYVYLPIFVIKCEPSSHWVWGQQFIGNFPLCVVCCWSGGHHNYARMSGLNCGVGAVAGGQRAGRGQEDDRESVLVGEDDTNEVSSRVTDTDYSPVSQHQPSSCST